MAQKPFRTAKIWLCVGKLPLYSADNQQQYFSLTPNQHPLLVNQQYFSLTENQHQPQPESIDGNGENPRGY